MFASNDVFRMASALASHANARQSVISQNMANADTPGYHALDVRSFAESYRSAASPFEMRTTRQGHLAARPDPFGVTVEEASHPGDESPNGNSVSLEREMLNAAETRYSHDLALTVYRSGVNLLRTSLGRG